MNTFGGPYYSSRIPRPDRCKTGIFSMTNTQSKFDMKFTKKIFWLGVYYPSNISISNSWSPSWFSLPISLSENIVFIDASLIFDNADVPCQSVLGSNSGCIDRLLETVDTTVRATFISVEEFGHNFFPYTPLVGVGARPSHHSFAEPGEPSSRIHCGSDSVMVN